MTEDKVDQLEVLQPSTAPVTYEIGGNTYVQKPLSFFGKIELFSVLGNALEKALTDVSLGDILDVPDVAGKNAQDLSDADAFIKAIAKIAQYAPDFLKEIYAIALSIPRDEREEFNQVVEDISDDDGFKILEVFVDQNWKALMDFFSGRLMPLISKIQGSGSTSSKPSKRSRANTK